MRNEYYFIINETIQFPERLGHMMETPTLDTSLDFFVDDRKLLPPWVF
jgi:hypothetical protein